MADFTLLTYDQCFGKNKLEVFKKRGIKAEVTDFAILSGAIFDLDNIDGIYKLNGIYWTSTVDKSKVHVVDHHGEDWNVSIYWGYSDFAIRPVLPFSSIDDIISNGVSKRLEDGILEIEFGYYPQQEVNKNMRKKLEQVFKTRFLNKRMQTTGNAYTIISKDISNRVNPALITINEYEYDGKRYVRINSQNIASDESPSLTRRIFKSKDIVWIEVQPVHWLVDEEAKIMFSEKLLFAGMEMWYKYSSTASFEDSNIKHYLNNHFAKELLQGRKNNKKEENEKQSKVELKDKVLNLLEKTLNEIESMNISIEVKKEAIQKIKDLGQEYVTKMTRFRTLKNSSQIILTLDSEYSIQYEYIQKIVNLKADLEETQEKSAEEDLKKQLDMFQKKADSGLNDIKIKAYKK